MNHDLITFSELIIIISAIIIAYFIYNKIFFKKAPEERIYNELEEAIEQGDANKVYDMCKHLPLDILQMEDIAEDTILFSIIEYGYKDALQILLNRLSYNDFVKTNVLNQSPVMSTVFSHDIEICKLFVSYLQVADLNQQDDEGKTVLHYALYEYSSVPQDKRPIIEEIILFLIQSMNKQGIMLKDNEGINAYDLARENKLERVKQAVEYKT